MVTDNGLLQHRAVRISPHVIDTLLLLSAMSLIFETGYYPLSHSWVLTKIIVLVLYIAFGVMALRKGRTRIVKALFLTLAILAFGMMVSIALTHHPLGVFTLLT